MAALIEATDIGVVKQNKHILKDVSISIGEQDFITVIGPNGAGKSTLLKCLLNFYQVDVGTIRRRKNLRIGYMPQNLSFDYSMPITVGRFLRLRKNVGALELQKVLQETSTAQLVQKSLSVLSGGELQRVLLARSLLNNPELLVLDEPAQNLDISNQLAFYKLLEKIYASRSLSILMVSHDLHLVMASTRRVVCLFHHICCSGEPQAVTKDRNSFLYSATKWRIWLRSINITMIIYTETAIVFEPFIIRALVAGIGVAIIAGAIGCFVVWRRMAYFGDSLAHSALLGVALGLVTGLGINLGAVIICFTFALLLLWLQQKKVLATDTLLGILAHASLAIGIIAISMLQIRVDVHAYLFGDILTVRTEELWWIYIGGAIILILLLLNWSSLVLMTIHEDLAVAENVRVFFMHLLLMFLMTIIVAVSIRIVGILLIASMLIIPAATARQLARSPEAMAIIAALLGIIAVVGGIYGSIQFDTPSSPSIVAAAAALFVILFPISGYLLKRTDS